VVCFELKEFFASLPNSVGQLNPQSPDLPCHSIAIEVATEGPGSNDGLVANWSAHLENAISDTLLNAGHSCLEDPVTIEEVKRILIPHQGGAGRLTNPSWNVLKLRPEGFD